MDPLRPVASHLCYHGGVHLLKPGAERIHSYLMLLLSGVSTYQQEEELNTSEEDISGREAKTESIIRVGLF